MVEYTYIFNPTFNWFFYFVQQNCDPCISLYQSFYYHLQLIQLIVHKTANHFQLFKCLI